MAIKSTVVTQVPPELLEELHARLVNTGFSDYQGHAEWLNAQLADRGLRVAISKSALHRHGSKFEDDFNADIAESRAMLALAKAAVKDNDDPEGAMRDITTQTLQCRLMKISMRLRQLEDGSIKDLEVQADVTAKLATALAKLGAMDIQSQKFKDEYRAKLRAEMAEKLASSVKSQGITEETKAAIQQLLGIA